MKLALITLCLWHGVFITFGQTTTSTSRAAFDRWTYLGLNLDITYHFSSLENPAPLPSGFALVPSQSFALTALMRKDINHRFSYQLGIGIGNKSISLSDGDGRSSVYSGVLSVPLRIQYTFLGKERRYCVYRPFVRTGIVSLASVGNTNQGTVFSGGSKEEFQTQLRNYFSPGLSASMGIDVQHNKTGFIGSISIEGRMGLTPLNTVYLTIFSDTHQREVLYESRIVHQGSYVGITFQLFLSPFGYRKMNATSRD